MPTYYELEQVQHDLQLLIVSFAVHRSDDQPSTPHFLRSFSYYQKKETAASLKHKRIRVAHHGVTEYNVTLAASR